MGCHKPGGGETLNNNSNNDNDNDVLWPEGI